MPWSQVRATNIGPGDLLVELRSRDALIIAYHDCPRNKKRPAGLRASSESFPASLLLVIYINERFFYSTVYRFRHL